MTTLSGKSASLAIVQITAPDAVGGLERVVQALAIGHHRRGHRVTVVAVVDPGRGAQHPFFEPLLDAGVSIERVEVPPRSYVEERRRVRRIYERLRPDVIHSHGYRSDVLGVGIARGLGIPVVTTLHGSSRMGGRSAIHEWIQLAVLRRFDCVIAVSEPLAGELRGLWAASRRLYVIPNAWTGTPPSLDRAAARAVLGLPANRVVLGWVGRLIEVKATEVFLEALALLRDRHLLASVVGDGRCRDFLARRTAALGLQDVVRFHGNVFHIARAFRAFDVFVLSSRSEGTPVVLFEAMAAEVPIVATRVGGVPEVLDDGSALLVPADRPEVLAGAIAQALDDPGAAAARAAAARATLEQRHRLEPWLERHEALYYALVRARQR